MGHVQREVGSTNTMSHIGIGNHDTLRCGGRLRGGAQRYRPPPVDTPGQVDVLGVRTRTGMACKEPLLQVWVSEGSFAASA